MLLKTIQHTAGNKIRYEIDYDAFLEEGTSLSSGTVVLDPANSPQPTDVTIGAVTVGQGHRLIFMLSGGSGNEAFTVDVSATDSRGEIKNDTIKFQIVAP